MDQQSGGTHPETPSRLIIDLGAVANNLNVVRRHVGRATAVIAVVKADGYGLGMVPIARTLAAHGVEYLAVARLENAVQLRDAGITTPSLVLGTLTEHEIPAALAHDLSLTLVSLPFAERLHEAAMDAQKVVKVHCNIDTGMGRLGFDPDTAANQLGQLARFSTIDIEGVYTHLVQAHLARDPFTQSQLKKFRTALKQIDAVGSPYEIAHAANSAAILNYPAARFDAVRPGILMYGVMPDTSMERPSELRDVVRYESRVVFLKRVPAGTPIGYGRTYVTPAPTTVATVPAGYADGIPYSLSNKGTVLVGGRRCPILGSVTMDHIMVDATGVPDVAVNDVVTIIGTDGDQRIGVEEVASVAGTIPYAVLTGLSPRLPRVYVDETHPGPVS